MHVHACVSKEVIYIQTVLLSFNNFHVFIMWNGGVVLPCNYLAHVYVVPCMLAERDLTKASVGTCGCSSSVGRSVFTWKHEVNENACFACKKFQPTSSGAAVAAGGLAEALACKVH